MHNGVGQMFRTKFKTLRLIRAPQVFRENERARSQVRSSSETIVVECLEDQTISFIF
jgi:hypothetical protein